MSSRESTGDDVRERAISLFSYLWDLVRLRTPSITDVDRYERVVWFDDLPVDEAVWSIAGPDGGSAKHEGVWLEARRKPEPLFPEPPAACKAWTDIDSLRDPSVEPALRDTTTTDRGIERVADHPEVQREWTAYLNRWQAWKQAYEPWRAVQDLYSLLFQIHQDQKRLGEAFELIIGLGFLRWQAPSGNRIRRHALVAQATLEFEPARGVFTLRPGSEGARTALELDMLEPQEAPEPDEIRALEAAAAEIAETPWERVPVDHLLSSLANDLSDRGNYESSLDLPEGVPREPHITFTPALILRRRTARSLLAVVEKIRRDLRDGGPIPSEVRRLCSAQDGEPHGTADGDTQALPGDPRIYFSLPANEEQLSILTKLARTKGVLVQGPPGTGKSHTIANLICHLLASGQRVLVTAQTPRALAVLQSKVPKEVSELCVSLLGNDRTALENLERCVMAISGRWANREPAAERRRISDLEQRLTAVSSELASLETTQRSIRERDAHAQEVASAAYRGTAQRIAERVAGESGTYGWVEDLVPESQEFPLDDASFRELREAFVAIEVARVEELRRPRPRPEQLPPPERFSDFVRREAQAKATADECEQALRAEAWRPLAATSADRLGVLEAALVDLTTAMTRADTHTQPWVSTAVLDVLRQQYRPLDALRERSAVLKGLRERAARCDSRDIRIPPGLDLARLQADFEDLKRHLQAGGGTGILAHRHEVVRRTRHLRSGVSVDGRRCDNAGAIDALLEWLRLRKDLELLWKTWQDRAPRRAGTFSQQVAELEQQVDALDAVLALRPPLARVGAVFGEIGLSPALWQERSSIDAARSACAALRARHAFGEVRGELQGWYAAVEAAALAPAAHPVAKSALAAISNRDLQAFADASAVLRTLERDSMRLDRREKLHRTLSASAPKLAASVAATAKDPAWEDRLGQVRKAWAWSQARCWLAQPSAVGGEEGLALAVADAEKRMGRLQAELSAARAWDHCFSPARMTDSRRQHLVAWQQAMRRVGKGTGKYTAKHLRDAQTHLEGCRDAIPAWVMPLHRLYDTVVPRPEMFDVVIVDEASQCGADALVLFYLAKKIVIVGDDQQISPEAVGVDREAVHKLIARHLVDVDHADSFTIDNSLFAQGEIRYGNRVVLREHFRCVPEIIQFSNDLCYVGQPLKPLRQYPLDRLRPLVARRIEGGFAEGTGDTVVNRAEAQELVRAVLACCRDPRYQGLSMGVISLQGEAQAHLIESLLLEHLDPKEMEERRLICGDAYSFQGDERHVMFLSLVAAPNRRIGSLTKETDKRRFNVAASRAQDQMWLLHTAGLNDLSPQCLRHRLLKHFLSPQMPNSVPGIDSAELKAAADEPRRDRVSPPPPFESWFEVDVFLRVNQRGFRAIPQYKVGHYRIDLVIEGREGRLAIECDGDEWHGADRFAEDMARQRALQRCGWPFWRVRGSEFYLAPDRAMLPLWQELERRRIVPSPDLSGAVFHGYVPALADEPTTPPVAPTVVRTKPATEARPVPASRPAEITPEPRAPASDDNVEWAEDVPAETWFSLAHWAKVYGQLAPWERSMLYSIGRRRAGGYAVTPKQAKQARRVFDQATTAGFKRES